MFFPPAITAAGGSGNSENISSALISVNKAVVKTATVQKSLLTTFPLRAYSHCNGKRLPFQKGYFSNEIIRSYLLLYQVSDGLIRRTERFESTAF